MSEHAKHPQPLTAEEEAELREAVEGWVQERPVKTVYAALVQVFATLDAERLHRDALSQDRDDWKKAAHEASQRCAAMVLELNYASVRIPELEAKLAECQDKRFWSGDARNDTPG